MATWDSYTTKATPADNDTLMIKDTAGGANKRTPFSGVWNWILSKLTAMTVLQNGADLNDCMDFGTYVSLTAANTFTNMPPDFKTSFRMIVTPFNSSSNRTQIIISSTSKSIYIRVLLSSSGWTEWSLFDAGTAKYNYVDYTGDDIDSILQEIYDDMPTHSSRRITLRTIDATDSDHVLNKNVWLIDIWRPSTLYGEIDAKTYNANMIYKSNYVNGVMQPWQYLQYTNL